MFFFKYITSWSQIPILLACFEQVSIVFYHYIRPSASAIVPVKTCWDQGREKQESFLKFPLLLFVRIQFTSKLGFNLLMLLSFVSQYIKIFGWHVLHFLVNWYFIYLLLWFGWTRGRKQVIWFIIFSPSDFVPVKQAL